MHILASILAFNNSTNAGKYNHMSLVTEDKAFCALAEQYISVCGIPDPPLVQGDLFD